jgi:hypothetical protein
VTSRVRLPVLGGAGAGESAPAPLPTLNEATLDWDAVDCVLADLDDFVKIRELIGRPGRGSPIPLHDIVEARDRFVAGELHGLQITYDFADRTWIDTLLRIDDGARLLRMEAP